MDCIVHGVAKSWTRLSDFHFQFLPFNLHLVLVLLNLYILYLMFIKSPYGNASLIL